MESWPRESGEHGEARHGRSETSEVPLVAAAVGVAVVGVLVGPDGWEEVVGQGLSAAPLLQQWEWLWRQFCGA